MLKVVISTTHLYKEYQGVTRGAISLLFLPEKLHFRIQLPEVELYSPGRQSEHLPPIINLKTKIELI